MLVSGHVFTRQLVYLLETSGSEMAGHRETAGEISKATAG